MTGTHDITLSRALLDLQSSSQALTDLQYVTVWVHEAVLAGTHIRLGADPYRGDRAVLEKPRAKTAFRMRIGPSKLREEKTNSMPERKVAKKSPRGAGVPRKLSMAFTEEEKAAMRELVRERQRSPEADGEAEVLAKIAEMQEPDRNMARRIHALVKASAPTLSPKTWYGMPAYAKDGKVVCFFQSGQKFKARYATLGFNDSADLDEGVMWPVAFALKELGAAEEARIVALVRKAAR